MPRCAACNTTMSHAAAAMAASPLRCQNSRSNSRSGSWACAKRVITTGSAISTIIRRFPMIQEPAGHQVDGEQADDNHGFQEPAADGGQRDARQHRERGPPDGLVRDELDQPQDRIGDQQRRAEDGEEAHQAGAKGAKQSHDRAGGATGPAQCPEADKARQHEDRRKSPKYRCQSCGRPFGDFVKLEEHPCKKADARAWRPMPAYGRQRTAESLSTRARTLHIQQFNGIGGTATTARNDMAATNARSQKVAEIGALRLPGGMIESELPAGGARLPLAKLASIKWSAISRIMVCDAKSGTHPWG